MPFLLEHIRWIASNHLCKEILEYSKIVSTVTVMVAATGTFVQALARCLALRACTLHRLGRSADRSDHPANKKALQMFTGCILHLGVDGRAINSET